MLVLLSLLSCCCWATPATRTWGDDSQPSDRADQAATSRDGMSQLCMSADCTGHVVPGARPCALGTFSYLVTSRSYFCLSYPNRFL